MNRFFLILFINISIAFHSMAAEINALRKEMTLHQRDLGETDLITDSDLREAGKIGPFIFQCYDATKIKVTCQDYDCENGDCISTLLINAVNPENQSHTYHSWRAIQHGKCLELRGRFRRILKNTAKACISGQYADRTNLLHQNSWPIERMRTVNGVETYF